MKTAESGNKRVRPLRRLQLADLPTAADNPDAPLKTFASRDPQRDQSYRSVRSGSAHSRAWSTVSQRSRALKRSLPADRRRRGRGNTRHPPNIVVMPDSIRASIP